MLTFFPSNSVASKFLRSQHVHLENPPLSCQTDCVSLSQDSRDAGCLLPGLANMPTTSFLRNRTFWFSGSQCLIHPHAHKECFRGTWIIPGTTPTPNRMKKVNEQRTVSGQFLVYTYETYDWWERAKSNHKLFQRIISRESSCFFFLITILSILAQLLINCSKYFLNEKNKQKENV